MMTRIKGTICTPYCGCHYFRPEKGEDYCYEEEQETLALEGVEKETERLLGDVQG